uniref:Signal peptidase complex subunit 3 n=1 Tax=Zeugodacus cucurbitae TaxID=28588 RepID=A0A0A1WTA3_ZEUCU
MNHFITDCLRHQEVQEEELYKIEDTQQHFRKIGESYNIKSAHNFYLRSIRTVLKASTTLFQSSEAAFTYVSSSGVGCGGKRNLHSTGVLLCNVVLRLRADELERLRRSLFSFRCSIAMLRYGCFCSSVIEFHMRPAVLAIRALSRGDIEPQPGCISRPPLAFIRTSARKLKKGFVEADSLVCRMISRCRVLGLNVTRVFRRVGRTSNANTSHILSHMADMAQFTHTENNIISLLTRRTNKNQIMDIVFFTEIWSAYENFYFSLNIKI